jgi:ADP-ribose pyrophosphatase YjhB (NUDIX family)
MMLENKDGSVSLHGIRFMPLMVRRRGTFEPVHGVYALPGGGVAAKHELPEIARLILAWMYGENERSKW